MNVPALATEPPAVDTATVRAPSETPEGTVIVAEVALIGVTVAETPPIVTVKLSKFVPVIVNVEPRKPLDGLKPDTVGASGLTV